MSQKGRILEMVSEAWGHCEFRLQLLETINKEQNSEMTISNNMNKCHILSNKCVQRHFDGCFDCIRSFDSL